MPVELPEKLEENFEMENGSGPTAPKPEYAAGNQGQV